MSEPIKVGDLVVVVRWPCCGSRIGLIRQVEDLRDFETGTVRCAGCGFVHHGVGLGAWMTTPRGIPAGHVPLRWLKRIPPLSELESEKKKDEVPA